MQDDTVSTSVSTPQSEKPLSAALPFALSYVRRGWPVLILHHLTELGMCSCGDTSEDHRASAAGKHPVAANWRQAAITDETVLTSVLAGRPQMNLGILTGQRAGLWVLDVDPKHDGDKRLSELETEHGALPYTYKVRTGSGGEHHYWLLPDDFTPTNSRKRLPLGLDVRGEGGQVVAPPSVSGIGAYEVLLDLPLIHAPAWLLDLIRPAMPGEAREVTRIGPDDDWRAALAQTMTPNARLTSYAVSAVNDELRRLRDAVPGERNNTAFEVACSLIELINSPWAQLDGQQAWAAYLNAAEHAAAHGGFDQNEAIACWQSALRKIGTRGRAVPDAVPGGVLVGWNLLGGVPPFSRAEQVETEESQSTFSTVSLSTSPMRIAAPEHVDQISSVRNPSLTPEHPADPVASLMSEFLDIDQLAELPAPQWLIKDWLVCDSTAQIIGKPNEGKSFVALDMAMCVALGRAWRGRTARQGRVGYIIAEGAAGMAQRAIAWRKHFNQGEPVPGIRFLPRPIQATDMAGWDLLIMAIVQLGLDLVIFDTQARVTVGMDENSARDMGIFIEQVERIRRVTKACVVLVHHQGKTGTSARGSSALLGAVQTEITVSRSMEVVTVAVTKQKDSEYAAPFAMRLHSVEVGRTPGVNQGWVSSPDQVLTAGVLVDVDSSSAAHWEGLTSKAKLLKVLQEIFPGRGATKAEAKGVCLTKGVSNAMFYKAWDAVISEKLISQTVIDDKPTQKYVVTPVDQRETIIANISAGQ